MTERPDQFEEASHLRERVNAVGAQFLLTEVEAGLALINLADTSQDDEAIERRRALAHEAYTVVAERLARTGHSAVNLSADEQELLLRAHAELGQRLGVLPPNADNGAPHPHRGLI